jgi:NADP-dependent 3-hydroxy acid dehydrogenase YdfG
LPASQPIALVTGASSGIGAATVRALAARGYETIAAARRLERCQEIAVLRHTVDHLPPRQDASTVAE